MYFLPSSASACRVTTARRGVFKNGLARSLQRERIIGSCLVTIPNTTCFVDSISTCVQCDSHTVEDGQELANDVALSPFGHQETAPNERSYTIWMTSRKSKTRMLRVIEILLTLPTIEMLGSTVLDLFSSAVCHCRLMLSHFEPMLRLPTWSMCPSSLMFSSRRRTETKSYTLDYRNPFVGVSTCCQTCRTYLNSAQPNIFVGVKSSN